MDKLAFGVKQKLTGCTHLRGILPFWSLVYSLGHQVRKYFLVNKSRFSSTPYPESIILMWCLPHLCLFHYCSSLPAAWKAEREEEGEPDSVNDASANFPFYAGAKRCRETYSNLWPLRLRRGRPVWAAAAHPEAEEAPRVLPICLLPWELLPLAAWKRCAAPEAWRSVQ